MRYNREAPGVTRSGACEILPRKIERDERHAVRQQLRYYRITDVDLAGWVGARWIGPLAAGITEGLGTILKKGHHKVSPITDRFEHILFQMPNI